MDRSHGTALVEMSASDENAVTGGDEGPGCGGGNSSYCAGKRAGALIGMLLDWAYSPTAFMNDLAINYALR